MSELLILEFDGLDRAAYERVNKALGINPDSGEGDWPAGLLTHSAGATEKGWIVVEVWESREDQDSFMKNRLGAALQQGGVDKPPTRVEWAGSMAHHAPGRASAATAGSAS
jgi:hypothetical protein